MLHTDVRSLAANYDKLISLLSHLTHNFHLLGISETKIMTGIDPVVNVIINLTIIRRWRCEYR